MKRILIYCLILLLGIPAQAQKNTKITDPNKLVEMSVSAMDEYHYSQAIGYLDEARKLLTKRRKPTEQVDSLQAIAEHRLRFLRGTDQVQIIDSMVVDKQHFLDSYKLSQESGNLYFVRDYLQMPGNGTVYQSELGNKMYFSIPVEGVQKIFTSDLLAGGKWSDAHPLEELADATSNENYPFVTSDGLTMYFATDDDEKGLGGYDIYVTRLSSSRYVRPENLGMPYNSTANDYMYVVDELNGIGWFASDRYQPEGKVCIYMFIPNESRNSFDFDQVDEEQIARVASLQSIQLTQTDQEAVAQARIRLRQAREYQPVEQIKSDFSLIINDQTTYYFFSDFKNSQAAETCKTWLAKKQELQQLTQELDQARLQYAQGKKMLSTQIRAQEQEYEALLHQVKQLEKSTRNQELGQ